MGNTRSYMGYGTSEPYDKLRDDAKEQTKLPNIYSKLLEPVCSGHALFDPTRHGQLGDVGVIGKGSFERIFNLYSTHVPEECKGLSRLRALTKEDLEVDPVANQVALKSSVRYTVSLTGSIDIDARTVAALCLPITNVPPLNVELHATSATTTEAAAILTCFGPFCEKQELRFFKKKQLRSWLRDNCLELDKIFDQLPQLVFVTSTTLATGWISAVSDVEDTKNLWMGGSFFGQRGNVTRTMEREIPLAVKRGPPDWTAGSPFAYPVIISFAMIRKRQVVTQKAERALRLRGGGSRFPDLSARRGSNPVAEPISGPSSLTPGDESILSAILDNTLALESNSKLTFLIGDWDLISQYIQDHDGEFPDRSRAVCEVEVEPDSSVGCALRIVPGAELSENVPLHEAQPTDDYANTPRRCTCFPVASSIRSTQRRSLVVFIDDKIGVQDTNFDAFVERLWNGSGDTYAERTTNIVQQVFYNSGTDASAFLTGYQWLAENYEHGDRIYMFGFARGAYQVRALSAMIERIGLLQKAFLNRVPFAHKIYKLSETITASDERNAHEANVSPQLFKAKKVAQFKSSFSRDVHVHFVGVWDTISVGETLPGTTTGMGHVCIFRHALALHEDRIEFTPVYARGELGPSEAFRTACIVDDGSEYSSHGDRQSLPLALELPESAPHTKEVWFTGTHFQLGHEGGKHDEYDALGAELRRRDRFDAFGPALRWMASEAMYAGAAFRSSQWTAMLSDMQPDGPRGGTQRQVQVGQLLHETAVDYVLKTASQSSIALPLDLTCDKAYLSRRNALERDLYATTMKVLDALEAQPHALDETELSTLRAALTIVRGKHILWNNRKILLATILSYSMTPDTAADKTPVAESIASSVRVLLQALGPVWSFDERFDGTAIAPLASSLSVLDEDLAQRFMNTAASPVIYKQSFGEDPEEKACTLAYSPDGTWIAVGFNDGFLRVWGLETGVLQEWKTNGPSDESMRSGAAVRSVAISPNGQRIATGSSAVCVWNPATGAPIGQRLVTWYRKPGSGPGVARVNGVAFSPRDPLLASGSNSNAVRVQNVETGELIQLDSTHEHPVRSVAFSPDGALVASGGDDSTVRLWEVQSGKAVGVWRAHDGPVLSVAFSPDGQQLASGSVDTTIRLWDAREARTPLLPYFGTSPTVLGHTQPVHSISFAPRDNLIASGSADGTVRVWNTKTGQIVGYPIAGHNEKVLCVAFSPDGKRVASLDASGTARVLDATGEWNRF